MPIFDLHCDTISLIYNNKRKDNIVSLRNNNFQIDVNKLICGNYFAQCFAMFIYYKVNDPFKECIKMIDLFYEELEKNDNLKLALTYEDLINNYNNKKINAILTIEEGGVCCSSLEILRTFHRLGVRMICLTWNFENEIGFPNISFIDGKPDMYTPNICNGLKEFGFQVVKEMNKLGMIVDVSHLSDKGFWDVINTSTKPIVASHSNCRSICKCVRNLTDEMIVALAKNGGVMGMNYCNEFLSDDFEEGKNTIECVIKHIKHIKSLVGVDVIALGSDFDGIDPNINLKDASMMNQLIEKLKLEGFTQEEIEKITYKNALRVFKDNLL